MKSSPPKNLLLLSIFCNFLCSNIYVATPFLSNMLLYLSYLLFCCAFKLICCFALSFCCLSTPISITYIDHILHVKPLLVNLFVLEYILLIALLVLVAYCLCAALLLSHCQSLASMVLVVLLVLHHNVAYMLCFLGPFPTLLGVPQCLPLL